MSRVDVFIIGNHRTTNIALDICYQETKTSVTKLIKPFKDISPTEHQFIYLFFLFLPVVLISYALSVILTDKNSYPPILIGFAGRRNNFIGFLAKR